jgi:toxin CcdB
MAQFDVYRNPNPSSCTEVPYLLDIQSDLLDPLATRVVVPLVTAAVLRTPARHLNPVFEILGEPVVMSTAELAGVLRSSLGPVVCSLAARRNEIIRALDFLISGV